MYIFGYQPAFKKTWLWNTIFPQMYMPFIVNISWRGKKKKNMQLDAESSASKCVNVVESESDKFNYGALLGNLEDALEI